MKLRMTQNSLRLRLSQSEVAQIGAGQRVEEAVAFGNAAKQSLAWALVPSHDAKKVSAHLDEGEITVTLPVATARAWAVGNEEGLEQSQALGNGNCLRIIIEKDRV